MAFQWESRRRTRRAWPIHAYTGPNGSGKSMAMVWDTLPSLEAGRRVLSTVRLLDYKDPRPCDGEDCSVEVEDHSQHGKAHPLWVPLTSFEQIRDARDCDLLLDEVTGVASSRTSSALPPAVANILVQLRRRDVVMRWSSPAWGRADLIIRETTQAVTYCRGMFPKTVQGTDRQWRHRRLGWWRTYDANEFEDFTAGKRKEMKPLTADLHYIPGSPAARAYDTFDAVLSLGHVSDAGRCEGCGGTRRASACSCPDYVEGRKSSRTRGPAKRGAGETAPTPLVLGQRTRPLDAVDASVALVDGVSAVAGG